jgi:hypothetical protein
MNLRKADRRDRERRFEREMQRRKAKPSAKQAATDKKRKPGVTQTSPANT